MANPDDFHLWPEDNGAPIPDAPEFSVHPVRHKMSGEPFIAIAFPGVVYIVRPVNALTVLDFEADYETES